MKKYSVYGIGNALVDREFNVNNAFLDEMGLQKGTMTLIDKAQQDSILKALAGVSHHRSCGGSAANTMIALAQVGNRAFHASKVADDETGAFFAADMRANGVENQLEQGLEPGTSGVCLVLITPDAERTLCTHLGISERFSGNQLSESRLAEAEYLYIEGYLVSSPLGRQAAVKAAEMARNLGVKTALTFSDTSMISFFREGLEAVIGNGLDLLFCNETEALAFAQSDDLDVAKKRLGEISKTYGLTLGPRGATVYNGREGMNIPGVKVTAVNTNGAGDLFAGAFLHGLTQKWSFGRSGRLACDASAVLVTQYGARLQPAQAQKLLNQQGVTHGGQS